MENEVRVIFYYDMHEDGSEPVKLCGFYTKHFGEWIRLLHYCKEYGVSFLIRDDDEKIKKEYRQYLLGLEPLIDDFWISYGSDNCLQCIEVLLK